jgi:hypothetical protein
MGITFDVERPPEFILGCANQRMHTTPAASAAGDARSISSLRINPLAPLPFIAQVQ